MQQFAYVARHDLQKPLRKILTFSNRLKEKEAKLLAETGKEFIDKINTSAQRMRNLINDLLNFSRVFKGGKSIVKTSLNDVIKNVLVELDLMVQEKRAKIITSHLPTVEAIPLQMNQLFFNLLGNAFKFTDTNRSSVIEISGKKLSNEEMANKPVKQCC